MNPKFARPKHIPPFQMWSGHQKLSPYQIILLYWVEISPQGINITLILTITSNIPPMPPPNLFHYDILLLVQFRISLFQHLVLQNICRYIHFITQSIKDIQIYTFSKHARFSNLRIPNNSQQLILLFFERIR